MKRKIISPEYPEFCGIANIGERGQLVIPIEARNRLKIKNKDGFVVMANNNSIILIPKNKMEKFVKRLTSHLSVFK